MTDAGIATAGGAAAVAPPSPRRRRRAHGPVRGLALAFLLPALILLGALVLYPIVFTVIRSFFGRDGGFIGIDNYQTTFTSASTLRALRNNAIWVVVAPSVVTAVGLVLAVLAERVKWSTAFKLALFMPMAISFLAAGVIFRLVYEEDPDRGVANAVVTSVHDAFSSPAHYPGARPRPDIGLVARGGAIETTATVSPGQPVRLPLVGLPPAQVPKGAATVGSPAGSPDRVIGVVWLDFARGGGGKAGVPDGAERGLPGMKVEAVAGGKVVDSAKANADGTFNLDPKGQPVTVRLAASNFREPFRGLRWLGPSLVTPAIIGAYVWIWAGFAMVLVAAGLAAIPRDALEAARVDGASEWQVFRRVTIPLLSPVLLVVFVTLVINVLKVFDLVLVIPPGSVQDDANVLALEMWRVSFGGARDQGLGSALGVVLFLLVLPAMIFNIRRFRREN
jgi:alpha-glucoside transport system permease protein